MLCEKFKFSSLNPKFCHSKALTMGAAMFYDARFKSLVEMAANSQRKWCGVLSLVSSVTFCVAKESTTVTGFQNTIISYNNYCN